MHTPESESGGKKNKRRKEFFGGRDEESQNPVRKKFEDDIDCITAPSN